MLSRRALLAGGAATLTARPAPSLGQNSTNGVDAALTTLRLERRGSSMTAFHVGLGALEGELIAVDGFEVGPIRGHEFPAAVAQRLA